MVVSHYVMSWIQVIGLLIGLMGVFYLSLPVFPDSALKYLRPLLPATALAILGAIGPFMFSIPGQGHDPASVVSTMVVSFLGGYFISYQSHDGNRRTSGVVVFALFALVAMVVLTAVVGGSLVAALPSVLFDLIVVLCFLAAILLPAHLTKDRVQYIGIVATILAVLTQFVPPVLDLLNISIR